MVSVIPQANVDIFYRRIGRVYNAWDELVKVDAIVVPVGQIDEIEYCKSLSVQEWLFNIEVPDLLMVFAKNAIVFLATKKKIDFLKTLQVNKDGIPEVTLLVRDENDSNKANFEKILSLIESNGTSVGTFAKDKFSGEFYQECMQNLFSSESQLERQDVSSAMAMILAVEEDSEPQHNQEATIIDKEQRVSHNKDDDKDDDEDDDDDDDDDRGDDDSDKDSDEEKDDKVVDDEEDDDEDDKGDDDNDKDSDEEKDDKVVDDEDDDDEDKDDDEDDEDHDRKPANHTVYDFDVMMAKKKEENSRKRRRRGYDIINDNDDIIADIINQMKDAVEADIEANKNKQVATNKLKLLPFLINQLRKVDLRDAFLDSDVLSVITEWLAPLPDRSLPHLNIRENLLKILIDFNLYDVDRIKSSGIGKSVMYLYKHPRETKENKQRAKQLISAWSRPIFNLDSSFSAISREEREERDKELQKRASRTLVDSSDGEGSSQAPKRVKETAQPAKNPGEKGWIPRARVPAPSMRDYVIRPRSKVDGDIGKGSKRPANMLEKLMKTHQDRRRANKQQRAINMKIDKL